MKKKPFQQNLQLFLLTGILLVVNLLASGFFVRWDLTKEKRYSLSAMSIETVRSLENDTAAFPIYVQVYLEGEFPPEIRRFQEAIRTTLIELGYYSGGLIDYEFIDPTGNPELQKEFAANGFPPVPMKVREAGRETLQNIFPLVVLRYRGREQIIDLFRSCIYPNGAVNVEKAESQLEYKLISAMQNLTSDRSKVVAILQGHGEIPYQQLSELSTELNNVYQVFAYDMKTLAGKGLPDFDAVIIPQPNRAFSERDKYELDQYLMRGGSLFWILDQQIVDMDMYEKRSTLTQLQSLNLDDMFMKYGFKLNYDLIQDLKCETTEVMAEGQSGAVFTSQPWIFYPRVLAFPEHPVTRNIEAVLLRYASSIDTFAQEGVKKSVFLKTSDQSRAVAGNQFIDLSDYLENPRPAALFREPGKIAGALLEGRFQSLFVGREVPRDSAAPGPAEARFIAENFPQAPGRMAIISDGEFVLGNFFRGQRRYLPYDNKTLAMNVVDYLAGDQALAGIRSKEVVARRLDRDKVIRYQGFIRTLNLALPVLLMVLFGVLRYYLRKRRQERLKSV